MVSADYIRGAVRMRSVDPSLADQLVAHLADNGLLVARVDRQALQAQPLSTVRDRRDRGLLLDPKGLRSIPARAPRSKRTDMRLKPARIENGRRGRGAKLEGCSASSARPSVSGRILLRGEL